MPHTIQLYKIPTKRSFEHLKKKKKKNNRKSKQHTAVMITEGGTSQDIQPETQASYCLTTFVYNDHWKGKHCNHPKPSMVSSAGCIRQVSVYYNDENHIGI